MLAISSLLVNYTFLRSELRKSITQYCNMTMGVLPAGGERLSLSYLKLCSRGGSRISGKGVHMYKGVGLALLIFSHFI